METSMINIPIYVDKEKLLEKPVTKKEKTDVRDRWIKSI